MSTAWVVRPLAVAGLLLAAVAVGRGADAAGPAVSEEAVQAIASQLRCVV